MNFPAKNDITIYEIAYPEVGYGKTKTQEKIMANIELLEKTLPVAPLKLAALEAVKNWHRKSTTISYLSVKTPSMR